MIHYVYVLMNQYGVVEYIGETTSPNRRMNCHRSQNKSKFKGRVDLTLEVVKEFANRSDALKYEGELKLSLGFIWNERERSIKRGREAVASGLIYEMQRKSVEARIVPVSAYLKDTVEYVGTYTSQKECAIQLGLHATNITSVLKGKQKSAGGYTFKRESNP